jgi:hypothetical protein
MAKNETKRLRPAQIQLNKDHFANLKTIAGYAPANPAYTTALIDAAETQMNSDGAAEAQAVAAAAAARDSAVASEWKHHNLMLGARDQVVAQFGRDSNEAQMVGLTKKSERKSPGRKPTKTTPAK